MSSLIPYRFNRHPMSRSDFSFDDFFRPFFMDTPRGETNSIRVDVKDEGDHYILEADMPGIKKEDVSIEVDDGMLTISAEINSSKSEQNDNYIYNERRSGKFSRSFSLNGIDEDKITASCVDGVLKLNLPKQVEVPKTGKKIAID
ncbi:MAG: Hsp20/alpha crystallin family protein [Clostridia bacterium]|nr:Hsp20/alpha crystallin family protein [Clostridia bacterium]